MYNLKIKKRQFIHSVLYNNGVEYVIVLIMLRLTSRTAPKRTTWLYFISITGEWGVKFKLSGGE